MRAIGEVLSLLSVLAKADINDFLQDDQRLRREVMEDQDMKKLLTVLTKLLPDQVAAGYYLSRAPVSLRFRFLHERTEQSFRRLALSYGPSHRQWQADPDRENTMVARHDRYLREMRDHPEWFKLRAMTLMYMPATQGVGAIFQHGRLKTRTHRLRLTTSSTSSSRNSVLLDVASSVRRCQRRNRWRRIPDLLSHPPPRRRLLRAMAHQ